MTIKKRLDIFKKYKKLTAAQFEEVVGMNNRAYANIGVSLHQNLATKIKAAFPELNLNWVLTGEGEMILEKDNDIELIDIIKHKLTNDPKFINTLSSIILKETTLGKMILENKSEISRLSSNIVNSNAVSSNKKDSKVS